MVDFRINICVIQLYINTLIVIPGICILYTNREINFKYVEVWYWCVTALMFHIISLILSIAKICFFRSYNNWMKVRSEMQHLIQPIETNYSLNKFFIFDIFIIIPVHIILAIIGIFIYTLPKIDNRYLIEYFIYTFWTQVLICAIVLIFVIYFVISTIKKYIRGNTSTIQSTYLTTIIK